MPIRSLRRPFRKSPSNKSWTGVHLDSTLIAGNTKVLVATFSLSNTTIDETVLRSIGRVEVRSDQVAASENQLGAMGWIVVNNLAVVAGVASIPGPITDIGDDGWFVFVPFAQRLNVGDSTGLQPNFGTGYDFNSKAKRKVEDGFKIAVVVENGTSSGFTISGVWRMLTMVSGT